MERKPFVDYMASLLMDREDYMDSEKYEKQVEKITEELAGVIFQNPVTDRWETADEYLSGNVRDKLETAKVYAENHPEYAINVQALTQVQPKELDASEIEVRIGATFVVPNHLTEQWASDFLRLYPGANILAATKKDFEPANRKKFCSRIATGDYDAVIIGHSQFEKIPLSQERQAAIVERQIEEITLAIEQAKADNGERYTIK